MSIATASNIKRLLALTGLTHEELGEIAGVSRSAVSQWVRGSAEPRMGAVQRIADRFGIWKADIIEDGGMDGIAVDASGRLYHTDPRDDDYVWRSALSDEEQRTLLYYFDRLTPTERDMVISYASFLLERGEEMAARIDRGKGGKPYLGDLGSE